MAPTNDHTLTDTKIPPLRHGDRLTRDEFERRYEAMPHVKKAELIEGVVYMPSPVRVLQHGRPHITLGAWMRFYDAATPGVFAADNSSVRLDEVNAIQPDALLMIDPKCGGQAKIADDGYVESSAELLAEVSASSAHRDLTIKLEVYRRNGVREYIVWRVLEEAIDWFVLRGEQYEKLEPDGDGLLKSTVFPGLCLDPAAMIGDDMARVLAVLQQGIASDEHAKFVERLNAK